MSEERGPNYDQEVEDAKQAALKQERIERRSRLGMHHPEDEQPETTEEKDES